MAVPRLAADTTSDALNGFARIRAELHVPATFPLEVLAAAAARPAPDGRPDRTALALVTIDPAGSRDLDQAYTAERRGEGYRVWYAIADVGWFVPPGGVVDLEAHARGVTLYTPDRRAPLYPEALGEGAASLLPGRDRPAVLWCIDLDASGATTAAHVERATVRSRAARPYADVQVELDGGPADPPLVLLREIGLLREGLSRARGGIELNLPDQQIVQLGGRCSLEYRAPLPVEGWNAQISLLTGMEAAAIMLREGIGLLRTVPPLQRRTVDAVRRSARALGVPWPDGMSFGDVVRSVDRGTAAGAALVHQAARAFRGASYLAFDGTSPARASASHVGLAAPYAHVTAPLRRLADRVANEVVIALCAGEAVPAWARDALGALPKLMDHAHQREQSLNAAMVDYMEALVLSSRVGDTFRAVVTDLDARGAVIQLRDPAVLTRVRAPDPGVAGLGLGEEVSVRLVDADPAARRVVFEPALGSVGP